MYLLFTISLPQKKQQKASTVTGYPRFVNTMLHSSLYFVYLIHKLPFEAAGNVRHTMQRLALVLRQLLCTKRASNSLPPPPPPPRPAQLVQNFLKYRIMPAKEAISTAYSVSSDISAPRMTALAKECMNRKPLHYACMRIIHHIYVIAPLGPHQRYSRKHHPDHLFRLPKPLNNACMTMHAGLYLHQRFSRN